MASKPRLEILGLPQEKMVGRPIERWSVKIDGVTVYLDATAFRMVTMMAAARVWQLRDGFVPAVTLEPGGNCSPYMYRLKKQISWAVNVQEFSEGNGEGSYRLRFASGQIVIHWKNLVEFPHADVQKLIPEDVRKDSELGQMVDVAADSKAQLSRNHT